MKPLTIWQLDPANLTPFYNIALCDALAQAGCRVRYFTTRFIYDQDLTVPTTYTTDYLYFKGLNHPRLLNRPRLRRILRALSYPFGHWHVLRETDEQRPDIIHIQWSRLPAFDLELVMRLKRLHIPVVHTIHDVVPLFAQESSTDRLRAIYGLADRLIVHTQANIDDLLTVFPELQRERIRIIPLVTRIDPSPGIMEEARDMLELPQDAPIFLFFGAIRHYKGLDVLLAAWENVVTARPDAHLIVAGRADPLERDKIPALNRLPPNVHLVEGFIPDKDVWVYHMAADAAVYPYRHIYQSAALTTAMAYGKAILATQVGGLAENIDGNGWLVPPEDPEALAEALIGAAEDRALLAVMGQRSRELIESRYAPPLVAKRLIEIYEELL